MFYRFPESFHSSRVWLGEYFRLLSFVSTSIHPNVPTFFSWVHDSKLDSFAYGRSSDRRKTSATYWRSPERSETSTTTRSCFTSKRSSKPRGLHFFFQPFEPELDLSSHHQHSRHSCAEFSGTSVGWTDTVNINRFFNGNKYVLFRRQDVSSWILF